MSARPCIHEHDVVTLTHPVEGWPAGTRGTVVDHRGGRFVVEVPEKRGGDLGLIVAARDDLALAVPYGVQRAASA